MPFSFFTKKFNPKRDQARKAASLSNLNLSPDHQLEPDGNMKVKIGENLLSFDSGDWIIENGQAHTKNIVILKKQLKKLKEENNMHVLKFELLLDMMAKKTAESNMQEHLIEELKRQVASSR